MSYRRAGVVNLYEALQQARETLDNQRIIF